MVIDGQLLRTRIVIRRQTGHPVFFFFGGEADANTQALKSGGSGEVLE